MERLTLVLSVAIAALAYFAWQQTTLFDSFFLPSIRDVKAELSQQLSQSSALYIRGDSGFEAASERWENYAAPQYQALVEPSTEEDVQAVVKYANEHSLPFLTVGGGHAWTTKLKGAENGIGISLRKMKKTEMNTDGKSARLGGGLKSGEAEKFFSSHGKRSLTGGCECTGMMGVALGGGHGLLQGQYGLLADQILEARLVLANSTAVTVSADENPDLYWAIRGAGQNFGIVTEYSYKVYDMPPVDNWVVMTFIYTNDKIEELYREVNALTKNGTDPVVIQRLIYEGLLAEVEKYAPPFRELGPIFTNTQEVKYSGLSEALGYAEDSVGCARGSLFQGFPITLQKYSLQAQRAAYEKFDNLLANNEDFRRSWMIFEGYSHQAVRKVNEEETSVADRLGNYITSTSIMYSKAENNALATRAGAEIRKILRDGSGEKNAQVYIGYGTGDEKTEEIYGYDEKRIQKLRELKKLYDPKGRFSFYAPIV
ncbi:FAD-binding domain-containing protein [Rhizodiscina lignyota]|uniref:FAD-binding domain-containing protein n=1 Tax=Rhizodiscina lignyota TaxID=1504668 RepID=A0A9P4IPQ9_9PEZI|nr:FAD-binding domain-containing protein [Rhizodiscina lignyota]